jgi:hypothetical protein
MTAVLNLPATRSTIRTVALDDITIDPRVQRAEGVDQRRINRMIDGFDPDALGVLILSLRADGTLVCLDGMHRRALAMQAGWKKPVDARVFTGLRLDEEAALFLLYNDKKDPSAISRFKARVLACDEVAVDINNIVTEQGWTVRQAADVGTITAVDALEAVYRTGAGSLTDGAYPVLTERTIATITDTWGHEPIAVHQTVLKGVAQLYGRYGSAVDTPKLVREMQDTQPRVLIGRAKTLKDVQGGTVPAALAKILVSLHNNRRRSNLLPEWVWVR